MRWLQPETAQVRHLTDYAPIEQLNIILLIPYLGRY
jgi:hypothetical protein